MPTCRYEERIPRLELDPAAPLHRVAEEDVTLLPGEHPVLVELHVLVRRRDQPEDLPGPNTETVQHGW